MNTRAPALELAIAMLAIVAATASGHGMAAAATAGASCIVVEPVTVTKSADLSFGTFAAGAGGSVTVSTGGVRTVSGVIASADDGAMTAATFIVSGKQGASFSVRHGGTSALSRVAGSGTMALTTFSDLGAANAAGTQAIRVGGTVNVAPNQAAGKYAGDVSVTVEYN
jgi:spore coat protein U-like protein